jgi:spore germination cell wall hydrolase CwlJ-like protein
MRATGRGSVVLNRVNDPRFPDSVRGVIYSPNQFRLYGQYPTYFDIALQRDQMRL